MNPRESVGRIIKIKIGIEVRRRCKSRGKHHGGKGWRGKNFVSIYVGPDDGQTEDYEF